MTILKILLDFFEDSFFLISPLPTNSTSLFRYYVLGVVQFILLGSVITKKCYSHLLQLRRCVSCESIECDDFATSISKDSIYILDSTF